MLAKSRNADDDDSGGEADGQYLDPPLCGSTRRYSVTIRTLDLRSRGRWFDSRSGRYQVFRPYSTRMQARRRDFQIGPAISQ